MNRRLLPENCYPADTLRRRFYEKVDTLGPLHPHNPDMGPCWLWTGACTSKEKAYGLFCHNYKWHRAHRFSYALEVSQIPEGMSVCHSCDTTKCVRPSHLFLASHADNMADASKKGRMRTNWSRATHLTNKYYEAIPRGEDRPNAKLNDSSVLTIRELAKTTSQAKIARRFGVSRKTIGRIIDGTTWSHVTIPELSKVP